MNFKNIPNKPYQTEDGIVWGSRSVAVTGVIKIYDKDLNSFILVSKRGQNSADYQGKMNLVAGYLDWNENGTDAFIRETWEETGFDINEAIRKYAVIQNNVYKPWSVNSEPTSNLQNVTLRYGLILKLGETDVLPLLTTEHNEIEGECEDPQWIPEGIINQYEWAFDHEKVIYMYSSHAFKKKMRKCLVVKK